MSGEQTEDDKQFDPTPKKLEDARKKGEVPRSVDLTTAAAYGGLLVAAVGFGPSSLIALGGTLQSVLDQADTLARVTFAGSQSPMMGGLLREVGWHLLPWFLIPATFAVGSVVAQRAFIVAPTKIQPKLSRISLIQGVKNKFGRQGLFEFFKSMAKLVIYGVILGVFLYARRDDMIGAIYLGPGQIAVTLLRLTLTLMLLVLLVALALGAVDFLFQRATHLRKHRMSRKELMDELKQSEGDPTMKQNRRQRGIDLATNKMLSDVPDADVVVVNPTHYAVALKWDRTAGLAPRCVAKGVDEIAARIREIAQDNAIPLHSDPPTARALHAAVAIGDEIAPEHYKPVAAAIRFAERMRQKMRHQSP